MSSSNVNSNPSNNIQFYLHFKDQSQIDESDAKIECYEEHIEKTQKKCEEKYGRALKPEGAKLKTKDEELKANFKHKTKNVRWALDQERAHNTQLKSEKAAKQTFSNLEAKALPEVIESDEYKSINSAIDDNQKKIDKTKQLIYGTELELRESVDDAWTRYYNKHVGSFWYHLFHNNDSDKVKKKAKSQLPIYEKLLVEQKATLVQLESEKSELEKTKTELLNKKQTSTKKAAIQSKKEELPAEQKPKPEPQKPQINTSLSEFEKLVGLTDWSPEEKAKAIQLKKEELAAEKKPKPEPQKPHFRKAEPVKETPKVNVNRAEKFKQTYDISIAAHKESYGAYYETAEAFASILRSTGNRNPLLAQGGEFVSHFARMLELGSKINIARESLNAASTLTDEVTTKVAGDVANVIGAGLIITKFVIPGFQFIASSIVVASAVKCFVDHFRGTLKLTEFQKTIQFIKETREMVEGFIDTKFQQQEDLLTSQHRETIKQFKELSDCLSTIESNVIDCIRKGVDEVKAKIEAQSYLNHISYVERTTLKIKKQFTEKFNPQHLSWALDLALLPSLSGYVKDLRGLNCIVDLEYVARNPSSMTGLLGQEIGYSNSMPNWFILESVINLFHEVFNEKNTKFIIENPTLLDSVIKQIIVIQKNHKLLSDFFKIDSVLKLVIADLKKIREKIKSTSLENSRIRNQVRSKFISGSLAAFNEAGKSVFEKNKLASLRFAVNEMVAEKSLLDFENYPYPNKNQFLTLRQLAEDGVKIGSIPQDPSLFSAVDHNINDFIAYCGGSPSWSAEKRQERVLEINLSSRKICLETQFTGKNLPLAVLVFKRTERCHYSVEMIESPISLDLKKVSRSMIDKNSYDHNINSFHKDYFEFLECLCANKQVNKGNLFYKIAETSVVIPSNTSKLPPLVFPKKLITHLEGLFANIKNYYEITNKGFFLPKYSFCEITGKLDIFFEIYTNRVPQEFCRFTVTTLDELTVKSFNLPSGENATTKFGENATTELLLQLFYCDLGKNIGMPRQGSHLLSNGLVAPRDDKIVGSYLSWQNQADISECHILYNHQTANNYFNTGNFLGFFFGDEIKKPFMGPAEIVYTIHSAKILREFFEIRTELQNTCKLYQQHFHLLEANINLISSVDREELLEVLEEKFGIVDAKDVISIYDNYLTGIPEKTPTSKDFDDLVKFLSPNERAERYNQQKEDLANFLKFLQIEKMNIDLEKKKLKKREFKKVDVKPISLKTDLGEVVEPASVQKPVEINTVVDYEYQNVMSFRTTLKDRVNHHNKVVELAGKDKKPVSDLVKESFVEFLKEHFNILPVKKDGNCLFIALGHFIEKDHAVLRKEICNLMAGNDAYESYIEDDESSEDYINRMRELSSWGGDKEIRACHELMKKEGIDRSILVYDPTYPLAIAPRGKLVPLVTCFGNPCTNPIRILRRNESHYEILEEIKK